MDLAQIGAWNRRWLADGILLTPAEANGEWLRVRTHQRPIRPFHTLIGDAPTEGFERFSTIEGEAAGVVTAMHEHEVRVLGMVVADDSYVLVEGRTPDRARMTWMRDLVHTATRFFPLGLGAVRRRKYMYRPPADWQPVQREGAVMWLNPEFPRVQARITVHDARPVKWYAPGAVDRFLFVDENHLVSKDPPMAPVALVSPLPGSATRVSGRGIDGTHLASAKAQIQDERFIYISQYDARMSEWDSFLPTYDELVRSIEPIAESKLEPSAQQFVHWIE